MTTFSHLDPTKTDLAAAPRGRGIKNNACTARLNQRDTQYSIRDTKHSLHLPKILVKSHLFMQNKANLGKAHNELNSIPKKELRKIFAPPDNEKRTQNKPKTNPIQTQCQNRQNAT